MLYEDKSRKEMLEEFIVQQIKEAGVQGILLGTLGNRIHNKFKDFKVRDYGYSQFKQYVQSLRNVEVEEEDERYWCGWECLEGAFDEGIIPGYVKTEFCR
ncbi:OST-HTH/LOTUS domain [Dorea longicatena]|nr:OST-HTH/LOTUS domain [Dorea longicatena]